MRKHAMTWILSAIAIAAVAGLSRTPRSTTAATVPADRVIARLLGRYQTIIITSTNSGARYSVADSSGTMLVASITLDELRTRDLRSYEQVQDAVAGTKDAGEVGVWAGIDRD